MKWEATARRLLERERTPTTVLDGSGRIALANDAFAELLGERSLVGSPWPGRGWRVSKGSPPVAQGFREIQIATPGGRRLRLDVDVTPVGRPGHGAIVSVIRSSPGSDLGPPAFEGDLHYEVTASPDDFGTVLAVWPEGRRRAIGHKCYWNFFGRSEPCAECPAKDLEAGQVRTAVIADPALDQEVAVASARWIGPGAARVASRRVGPELLGHALRGRLAHLSERGGLSNREREVLEALVLGLSIDEMSTRMRISPRTVKFHQARALEKLGADSRTDLLRVVFG